MMQLHVKGDQPKVIGLQKSTYLIGRSKVCNLQLTDPELELVHARLRVEPHALKINPQDDAEVRVNGAPVSGETILEHGDELLLGALAIKVVDAQQKVTAAESTQADDEQTAPVWILQGLAPGMNQRYAITGTAVVGRAKECDIHISEAHLSRQHVRLTINEQGLVAEDLNSANGTYVNGRRIATAVLHSGDELSLDSVKFRIIRAQVDGSTDETLVIPEKVKPEPAKVTGPTAIDMQRASLRQMAGEFPRREVLAKEHGRHAAPANGWLTLAAMTVALAGALWGATSLLDTPFRG